MMNSNATKFVKMISDQLKKFNSLKDSNKNIAEASKVIQNRLTNIKTVAIEKYTTTVQDFQNVSPTPVPKTIIRWWQWYQHLTGLDAIEKAKLNVTLAQEKLINCQEQRRNISMKVTILNNKIQDISHELLMITRDNPKYVQLTIMENKNLQDKKILSEQLKAIEQEEKDYFTYLTSTIQEYHDAHSLNSQKYKYLSIAASIFSAIISYIVSVKYNNRKMNDLRNTISSTQDQYMTTISDYFHSLEKQFDCKLDNVINKTFAAVNKDSKNYTEQVTSQDTIYSRIKSISWVLVVFSVLKLFGI